MKGRFHRLHCLLASENGKWLIIGSAIRKIDRVHKKGWNMKWSFSHSTSTGNEIPIHVHNHSSNAFKIQHSCWKYVFVRAANAVEISNSFFLILNKSSHCIVSRRPSSILLNMELYFGQWIELKSLLFAWGIDITY
jgi:hypothetical protein